jgi:hypothetical protein
MQISSESAVSFESQLQEALEKILDGPCSLVLKPPAGALQTVIEGSLEIDFRFQRFQGRAMGAGGHTLPFEGTFRLQVWVPYVKKPLQKHEIITDEHLIWQREDERGASFLPRKACGSVRARHDLKRGERVFLNKVLSEFRVLKGTRVFLSYVQGPLSIEMADATLLHDANVGERVRIQSGRALKDKRFLYGVLTTPQRVVLEVAS